MDRFCWFIIFIWCRSSLSRNGSFDERLTAAARFHLQDMEFRETVFSLLSVAAGSSAPRLVLLERGRGWLLRSWSSWEKGGAKRRGVKDWKRLWLVQCIEGFYVLFIYLFMEINVFNPIKIQTIFIKIRIEVGKCSSTMIKFL